MFNILSKIRAAMEERKQDRFEREHMQLVLESSDDLMCPGIGERFTVLFDELFDFDDGIYFSNDDHDDGENDLVIDGAYYCESSFDEILQKCKYTIFTPWANYVFRYEGPGKMPAAY